jgi:hypothetical protein
MSPADRLTMLGIYGLSVTLSPDESRLLVTGRDILLYAAAPTLRQYKAELLDYLRTCSPLRATAATGAPALPSVALNHGAL